jgi:hypothetical protein
MTMMTCWGTVLVLGLAGCGGGAGGGSGAPDSGPSTSTVPAGAYRVLATNDLGMHCMDRDFSIYSILPPFNVLRTQVLQRDSNGWPRLLQPNEVDVTYEPVADATGSANSRSVGKTEFWTYVQGLFGATPPPGMGLTGLYMPDDAPTPGPQPLSWVAAEQVFHAFGIPITPTDDAGHTNPYPLLRVRATNPATHATLATLDVVVPVSGETDCRNCHVTGQIAARAAGVTWSTNPDTELQAKLNVLILHDLRSGTTLLSQQPVLCASCHDSPPLDLGGAPAPQPGQPAQMSRVMHAFHGRQLDGQGHPVFPPDGDTLSTCYQCHPGAQTECLRGAMKNGGMSCRACHGDMLAVGGVHLLEPGGSLDGQNDLRPRRPWTDMPRCQSCHTGDARTHLTGSGYVLAADGIRLRQAWRTGDPAASPIAAPTSRFAENPSTLYRFSKGHGGVSCENCHGSTHAEWPNADPSANDNVAATQLQGHTGTIVECAACHAGALPRTMNGPHGMHNVNQASFVDGGHEGFYRQDPAACQACHGTDLRGTVLSRAAADRTWTVEGQTRHVSKGAPVGCTLCHSLPGSGGGD